ncbi:hypothetical protein Btru_013598 [Bulinus truncatus]|nr:hypothetical protein Btru_013598 [Bulinus truncatus]
MFNKHLLQGVSVRPEQVATYTEEFITKGFIAVSLAALLYVGALLSPLGPKLWGLSPRRVNVNVTDTHFLFLHNLHLDLQGELSDNYEPPDGPAFQPIAGHDAWVFSAFFDTSDTPIIRVFGVQNLSLVDPVFCYLSGEHTAYMTEGRRTLLVDNHGNSYRVVSYECDVTETDRPIHVSLTFSESELPSNSLSILYPSILKRNFTVCYASLFNFTNYHQIVQNVEFNRVLGADHFFVYNMSVSPETDAVLQHYQQRGLLTVIKWSIPISEVHYHGQILAINDCVYRNKGVSKYVVIQDTDEFIIPNYQDNWERLIAKVDEEYEAKNKGSGEAHSSIGTYSFQSTFFQEKPNFLEWDAIKQNNYIRDEDEQLFERYSLTVFTHLRRLNYTFEENRQKSIVRPELALFPDVHNTMTHRTPAFGVLVDLKWALVHHQRLWTVPASTTVETTSLRFKYKVLPLVAESFRHLSKLGLQ